MPASPLPRLLDDLRSDDALRRETAVARLTLAGAAAVKPVLAVANDADAAPGARAAALRALAAIGDPRAVPAAIRLAGHADAGIAADAVDVLATHAGGNTRESVAAFERLTEIALDRDASVERRLMALSGLEGLPERTLRPVLDALAVDPSSAVVARVVRRRAGALAPVEEMIERGLPADPALVSAALQEEGGTVRVTVLRALIEAARAAESRERAHAAAWLAVRGQAHQILGARGSRIAMYDVREALERHAGPLPVGFLAAAAAVGDAACLTPIAGAWMAAESGETWWRHHLADAFAAIVTREKISRRDPVVKKMLERWPASASLAAIASKEPSPRRKK